MSHPDDSCFAVPVGPVDAEIVINRSRFLAGLRPVASRDEVHVALAAVRSAHPAASHHCYAYQLGSPQGGEASMSDDGEPSGTAGRPIFTVLRHQRVGNALLVVTRYFGGIKLGAGGLVRAYMAAAQAAVEKMETAAVVPRAQVALRASFAHEQMIRHFCATNDGAVVSVVYGAGADGADVGMAVSVPRSALEDLLSLCAAHGIAIR